MTLNHHRNIGAYKTYFCISTIKANATQQKRFFIPSLITSGDILTWNPQKEIVYHGRNIPNTNIIDLLDYTPLSYEAQIPEPRRLDLFVKGLAGVGINKTLIENEYLLTKEEHEMPESQSDDESNSSVVESDNSDDEKESVNESIQSDSDEEMESNSEKLTCHHCEKDHVVEKVHLILSIY